MRPNRTQRIQVLCRQKILSGRILDSLTTICFGGPDGEFRIESFDQEVDRLGDLGLRELV